jgi:hypothetical protein
MDACESKATELETLKGEHARISFLISAFEKEKARLPHLIQKQLT